MRLLYGFATAPDKAVFSRVVMFLPEMDILEQTLYGIMSIVYKDQAAYHINRDSTSIPAQEKAVKKREEEVSSESPQRTDGRGEGGDMPDLGGLTAAAGGINLEKIEEFALALEGGARPCFFRRLEFDGLAINGQEGMRSFRLIQDTRSADPVAIGDKPRLVQSGGVFFPGGVLITGRASGGDFLFLSHGQPPF